MKGFCFAAPTKWLLLWACVTAAALAQESAVETLEVRLNGLTPEAFQAEHPELAITYVAPRAERVGGIDYVPATLLESWYQLTLEVSRDPQGRRTATLAGSPRTGGGAISLMFVEGEESYTLAADQGEPQTRRLPPGARCYVNDFDQFMIPALPIVAAAGGKAFLREGMLHLVDPAAAPTPTPASLGGEPADGGMVAQEPVVSPATSAATAAAELELPRAASPEALAETPVASKPLLAPQLLRPGLDEITEEKITPPAPEPPDHFAIHRMPKVFPDGDGNPSSVVLRKFEVPAEVEPGAVFAVAMEWEYRRTPEGAFNPAQTVYITLLGDWAPETPLMTLVNGEPQGDPRRERDRVELTAPLKPGSYRLRWVIAFAHAPVQRFYGDTPGGVFAPGVGPYAEVRFVVRSAPTVAPTDTPAPTNTPAPVGVIETATPATATTSHATAEHSVPAQTGSLIQVDWAAQDPALCLFPSSSNQAAAITVEALTLPAQVAPSARVSARLDWTYHTPSDGAFDREQPVHIRAFGEWRPHEPLAVIADGVPRGQPRPVRKFFIFEAPPEPGEYRLRVFFTLGYRPVESFYGADPSLTQPGVSPYAEARLRVE